MSKLARLEPFVPDVQNTCKETLAGRWRSGRAATERSAVPWIYFKVGVWQARVAAEKPPKEASNGPRQGSTGSEYPLERRDSYAEVRCDAFDDGGNGDGDGDVDGEREPCLATGK